MIWETLFTATFGAAYSPRAFVANFGCSPHICSQLWDVVESESTGFKQRHLLWTLCFLKTYDTFATLATRFRVTEKTMRTNVWALLDVLYAHLSEVLRFVSSFVLLHFLFPLTPPPLPPPSSLLQWFFLIVLFCHRSISLSVTTNNRWPPLFISASSLLTLLLFSLRGLARMLCRGGSTAASTSVTV